MKTREEHNELIVPADDLRIAKDTLMMTWKLRGKFVDKIKYLFEAKEEERLTAAGYRKQSDTVREFVERLKQTLIDLYLEKNEKISLPDLEIDGIDIEMTINNLAAEYGVEVER